MALAIDPAVPATVWAGANQSATFLSTDGGGHWVARNNGFPPGTGVISLAIDPTDTSRIFAGTAQHGLYETTNGGAAWGKLSLSPSEVFGLAIDPVTTSTIFATLPGHLGHKPCPSVCARLMVDLIGAHICGLSNSTRWRSTTDYRIRQSAAHSQSSSPPWRCSDSR